ncbi:oxidoreductase-like domain-containing protein [Xanthomonas hortorum]|uniref:oxidoreductase-like domain-containing protein n=1 Tax=Xanthomonas hortorum TaxID=56454 RepID=UPI0015D5ED4A|nr:oxidoreductase-like domain-containing protein [Xanthomonas hortorum]MCE4358077.1 oxidoreductase-like domain-containing protein [Xanthomonas hortorum pv. taraxaci]NMI52645.1 oxidoreductase-like protein [Xanthomonas hortorum pv. taraxaci]
MPDSAVSATDPRPQPPLAPAPNECCESGCPLCVHDLYAEELARYRQALAAWQARQPAGAP